LLTLFFFSPRHREKFLSLCLQHISPKGDKVKDAAGEVTYNLYPIAKLAFEDAARSRVQRGADGSYVEEGSYSAGGVTHMVHVCSLVNKTWNQTANGNELWRLYLRRHALRNTYIGFGGLRGLYDNHIVFGGSGLESRLREGAWHRVDRLKYPRTRGQCAEATARPEAQAELDVPRSISLPSPVAMVRAAGDQIAALTVQGQLFTWKADAKSAGRPLSVPGLASKRVTVLSEYGAACTEDGELWAFAVDRTAMSAKLCRNTAEWLDIKAEGCVAFRCQPGIAALVTEQGSLYTWRPDSTTVALGRDGIPTEVGRVHVPRLKGASKAADTRLVAMNQQDMSDRQQLYPLEALSSLKANWELTNESELFTLVEELNRQMGNPGHDLAVEQYVAKLGHNPGHAFGQLHLGVFYDMLNRRGDADRHYKEASVVDNGLARTEADAYQLSKKFPEVAHFHVVLGTVFRLKGRWVEADASFTAAREAEIAAKLSDLSNTTNGMRLCEERLRFDKERQDLDFLLGQYHQSTMMPDGHPDREAKVVNVALGAGCGYVLTDQGEVFSFGIGDCGQLGTGSVAFEQKRESDWVELVSEDGKPYYYNKMTHRTSWDEPGWVELMDDTHREIHLNLETNEVKRGAIRPKEYYYNTITKHVTWQRPQHVEDASHTPISEMDETAVVYKQTAAGYSALRPVLVEALIGITVVHIDASGDPTHVSALTTSGEVWQWGGGFSSKVQHFHHPTCAGQLLSGKVEELTATEDYSVARCQDGKLYTMYFPPTIRNDNGQKYYMVPAEAATGAVDPSTAPHPPPQGAENVNPSAKASANQWPTDSTACKHWQEPSEVNKPPGDLVPASGAEVMLGGYRQPRVALGSKCWAAVAVYPQAGRMWRMALQERVFEPPIADEATYQLSHADREEERVSMEFDRDIILGQLRQMGVDTRNERIIEMVGTKFAGSSGSDVYDPAYISRVADSLVHFQLHGDHDFDQDDEDPGRHSRAQEEDWDDADDILSDAVAMVSVHSLKKAASSVYQSTGLNVMKGLL